jgi:hypothetical protein
MGKEFGNGTGRGGGNGRHGRISQGLGIMMPCPFAEMTVKKPKIKRQKKLATLLNFIILSWWIKTLSEFTFDLTN